MWNAILEGQVVRRIGGERYIQGKPGKEFSRDVAGDAHQAVLYSHPCATIVQMEWRDGWKYFDDIWRAYTSEDLMKWNKDHWEAGPHHVYPEPKWVARPKNKTRRLKRERTDDTSPQTFQIKQCNDTSKRLRLKRVKRNAEALAWARARRAAARRAAAQRSKRDAARRAKRAAAQRAKGNAAPRENRLRF